MKIEWWIIEKSLETGLSESERKQLEAWLEESPAHPICYKRIKKHWGRRVSDEKVMRWKNNFITEQHLYQRRKVYRAWWWGAAAVVLMFGIYGLTRHWERSVPENFPLAYVEPDRTKVHLTTSVGEVIEMSQLPTKDTLWMDGVLVKKEQQMLTYAAKRADALPFSSGQRENTLEVPRGAEFRIQLSDGTQVWLNSDSKISFPVVFGSQNRRIKLSGEAYFKVAHDTKRPFIVEANGTILKVLGTEFNVNTRNPEVVKTVLVEGCVQVKAAQGEPVILQPGELAEVRCGDGTVCVSKVYVREFIAWKNGEYAFVNTSMEDILKELSLWYDVEFVYQNSEVGKERFSGCLRRNENIADLLKIIEKTASVRFSIEQNQVMVSKVPDR